MKWILFARDKYGTSNISQTIFIPKQTNTPIFHLFTFFRNWKKCNQTSIQRAIPFAQLKLIPNILSMFQFFAIIVFGCISSSGWFFLQDKNLEVCVMNMDASACHFSTMVRILVGTYLLFAKINEISFQVGTVAFIASIGFLIGKKIIKIVEYTVGLKLEVKFALQENGSLSKCPLSRPESIT